MANFTSALTLKLNNEFNSVQTRLLTLLFQITTFSQIWFMGIRLAIRWTVSFEHPVVLTSGRSGIPVLMTKSLIRCLPPTAVRSADGTGTHPSPADSSGRKICRSASLANGRFVKSAGRDAQIPKTTRLSTSNNAICQSKEAAISGHPLRKVKYEIHISANLVVSSSVCLRDTCDCRFGSDPFIYTFQHNREQFMCVY